MKAQNDDGTIKSYIWDLGEGISSTIESPTRKYEKPGEYIVTLQVIDDKGEKSNIYSQKIVVTEKPNEPPLANFSVDKATGTAPLTVSFTDKSTDNDGRVVSYNWNFGDYTTSIERNPIHTYKTEGNYTVTLKVKDDKGAESYPATLTIKVNPTPTEKTFTNSIGMEFILISAGTFTMGSNDGESDEKPPHTVTISKPFYIGKYEVTQAQWVAVMGSNPSIFKGDNLPVEQVSWNDVQEFIRKLNAVETHLSASYRLPTEAEWEYACRAGTTTHFAFGNCLSTDDANYDSNYPLSGCSKGVYREKTMPVGSFRANAFGLYDMHGNVWEWCQDWYGNYPSSPSTDPQGPSTGSSRVLRGGSWFIDADLCRSANCISSDPGYRSDDVGFRVSRTK